MSTKKAFVIATLALVLLWGFRLADYIISDYQYEKQILSYWSLADKASTLEQKSRYMDQFVNVLTASNLQGTYNAVWLETPDNSFDRNFEALKSLQTRLAEIQTMNVKSFEYQQAISQITAQEQGEAHHLLEVFEGCWYMRWHFWLWNWVGATVSIFMGLLVGFFAIGIVVMWDD
jgi:hypothetical protein